jgi:hypothetical protein
MEVSHKSAESIERYIIDHKNDGDTLELTIAMVEEWMISGASACPREKTLAQRVKYFSNVKFSSLEELLKYSKTVKFV